MVSIIGADHFLINSFIRFLVTFKLFNTPLKFSSFKIIIDITKNKNSTTLDITVAMAAPRAPSSENPK